MYHSVTVGRYDFLVAHGLRRHGQLDRALLELDRHPGNTHMMPTIYASESSDVSRLFNNYLDGLQEISAQQILPKRPTFTDYISTMSSELGRILCRLAMIRAHGRLNEVGVAMLRLNSYGDNEELYSPEVAGGDWNGYKEALRDLDEMLFPTKTMLFVHPAYGADYANAAELMAAYQNRKDFFIENANGGRYVNIDDKPDYVILRVAYDRNTRVLLIM